jgi:hypothetical protein
VRYVGAGHHGFGRYAPGIHASTAYEFSLNHGDALASTAQLFGEWRPCLAGPNHDGIKMLVHEISMPLDEESCTLASTT